MKKFAVGLILIALGIAIGLGLRHLLPARQGPAGGSAPAAAEPNSAPEQQQEAFTTPPGPNTVAQIADYEITFEELRTRLISELQPYDYEGFGKTKITTAKEALMLLLGEKAMAMEGRKMGFLDDEINAGAVKRYRRRDLVNLLMAKHVAGKVKVTDAEIEARIKAEPSLDRRRALALIQRQKATVIAEEYYKQVYEESNVRKVRANYLKAAQLYRRLLNEPKMERKVPFIRNQQIREELSQQEKDIVLAVFNGGKATVRDWFETLGEIVPPRRPRDLHTPEGVDRLLEQTLKPLLLVARAVSEGLDKDPGHRSRVRDYEDRICLGAVQQWIWKKVEEPTDEQITAYFEANKELFRQGRKIRADQIWCDELATAKKARAELDAGKSFAEVKKAYSIAKDAKPMDLHFSGEGYFWDQLWKAEPDSVVGPIRGFYNGQLKWRLVLIGSKETGELPELDEQIKNRLKYRLHAEARDRFGRQFVDELLKKYPYRIFEQRFKDLDPLAAE